MNRNTDRLAARRDRTGPRRPGPRLLTDHHPEPTNDGHGSGADWEATA